MFSAFYRDRSGESNTFEIDSRQNISIIILICCILCIAQSVLSMIFFSFDTSSFPKEVNVAQIIIIGSSAFSFLFFLFSYLFYLHKKGITGVHKVFRLYPLLNIQKYVALIILTYYFSKYPSDDEKLYRFCIAQLAILWVLSSIEVLVGIFFQPLKGY